MSLAITILLRTAILAMVYVLVPLSSQVFAQGMEPEDEEAYPAFRAVPTFRAYLPAQVDLSDDFPIPQTQGSQSSCSAWAVGYALRSYYAIKQGILDPREMPAAFSPAYLYNQVINAKGNCTTGTRISDTLEFLRQNGTATLRDFPYIDGNCSAIPDSSLQQKSRPNNIDEWRRVSLQNLDDIKGELANGDPVVFGMMISNTFENLKRDEIYTAQAGPDSFGHAMVMAGYDDRRRAFKVINSWGDNWADDGFGWISYDSFSADANSAFVMRLASAKPDPEPIVKPVSVSKPKPAKTVDMMALANRLTKMGSGFKCSRVNFAIKPNGKLAGHGYVGNAGGLALLQAVGRVAGPGAVDISDIKVRPWPQCEALETFHDQLATATGLRVAVRTMSGSQEFVEDDKLVVLVRSPEFASYIYVTYLMVSGEAVHLYQSDWQKEPLAPNTLITLGNDPKLPSFRLAEPFGKEMVVVVASATPLFEREFDFVEIERKYLSVFRQRILKLQNFGDDTRVVARAVYLETQPK